MRLSNRKPFTPKERDEYTANVYDNLIEYMKALCYATEELGFKNELEDESEDAWEVVLNADRDQRMGCTPELFDALETLWKDEVIQEAWKDRARFNIIDSAAYFFENIERIREPGYKATDDDILRVRIRTRNIIVEPLQVVGKGGQVNTMEVIDVGGQQTERKKWIHYFDSVDLVIFIAALSEYNQLLNENDTENRMVDAIEEFERIINGHAFLDQNVVLFLNKIDLFEKKVPKVPIQSVSAFEDFDPSRFPSAESEVEAGMMYFEEKFLERNANADRSIFTHFTCATDTTQMSKLIDDAIISLAFEMFQDSGFI